MYKSAARFSQRLTRLSWGWQGAGRSKPGSRLGGGNQSTAPRIRRKRIVAGQIAKTEQSCPVSVIAEPALDQVANDLGCKPLLLSLRRVLASDALPRGYRARLLDAARSASIEKLDARALSRKLNGRRLHRPDGLTWVPATAAMLMRLVAEVAGQEASAHGRHQP